MSARSEGFHWTPPRQALDALVDVMVLTAVEHALELPEGERRAYLEGDSGLGGAAQLAAIRLLSECEQLEQSDRVRPSGEANERAPFSIDLATLVATEASLERTRELLRPDALIGPYRIVRFVAAGGMGEVYEAIDGRVGRRVAIKLLPAFASSERIARFAREAALMGRLEHPAIARLYEWSRAASVEGRHGELDFIAMEFIDGVTLIEAASELRARNPCEPHEIVELLLPVVDAVAHAHARGVLHRDIKPANILVERDGRARLLDFGVASVFSADEQFAVTMTSDVQRPGTLAYMSPEQVRGGGARVTTQSDVYALGLVLAESLTGERVVETEGRGIGEVVEDVLKREAPSIMPGEGLPGARSRGTWSALDFVVRKALRKDPGARHSSAAALAEDLRRVLAGEQPAGRRLGAIEAASVFVSRHRRALLLGAAVVTATALALAFGAVQFVRAREAEARSDVLVGQLLTGSKPLLFDLHARLRDEGQPLAARRAAFEASVSYLEWMRERSGADKRVLHEIAYHFRMLGAVAGGAGDASLGDAEAARASFGRSLEILDALIAAGDGSDPERRWRLLRAEVLRGLGDLESMENRPPFYRRAREDQRAAILLMPAGAERDAVERFFLLTSVQSARMANDLAELEAPLARLEELAREDRFADDADFWSEVAMARRYHLDLLESASRRDEALAAARGSAQAFERSIALGLDEFTNNRHLARVELALVSLSAAERSAEASIDLLLAALARSRHATNLKPGNSFARISFIEALGVFALAARDAARSRAELGDRAGADRIVARALEAFDEGERFIQAFPIEGGPHVREGSVLEGVRGMRGELAALSGD